LALRERAWFTKPSDGTSGSFASSRTQHGSAFVLERALDERDTHEMSAYSTNGHGFVGADEEEDEVEEEGGEEG